LLHKTTMNTQQRFTVVGIFEDRRHAMQAITELREAGLGALIGLGVLGGVIPVVGSSIAAGDLGVILSNAAAGADVVGLVGAFVRAGLPKHEAKYYQGELEAGCSITTENAADRADKAPSILRRRGGYDISSRSAASARS
jgi:hypothetical protein